MPGAGFFFGRVTYSDGTPAWGMTIEALSIIGDCDGIGMNPRNPCAVTSKKGLFMAGFTWLGSSLGSGPLNLTLKYCIYTDQKSRFTSPDGSTTERTETTIWKRGSANGALRPYEKGILSAVVPSPADIQADLPGVSSILQYYSEFRPELQKVVSKLPRVIEPSDFFKITVVADIVL